MRKRRERKTRKLSFELIPMVEGGTLDRLDKIERKVDSIMEFFGIDRMSRCEKGGVLHDPGDTEYNDANYTTPQPVKVHSFNTPLTEAEAEEYTRQWEDRHRLGTKKDRK